MTAAGEQVPATADPAADSFPPSSPGSRLDAVPPELLIILGSISVQAGGGLATTLIREYGPLPVVAMRIVFGAALLLLLRPLRLRNVSREAFGWGVALGLILAVMNSLFYVALSRIPIGVGVTIEFWGPLGVAILGSRRRLDLVWVVLAAAGIYVLAGARLTADDALGIFAAAASGLAWAIYILVAVRVAHHWPDGRGLSLSMVVASVAIVPVMLALSDPRSMLAVPGALAGGFAIALFSSAIPYTAELAALRRLPAHTFGVLMSLEPAIAAVVGYAALGQLLGWHDIVAIGCVVLASAGASVSARRLTTVPGELEST
jgi:inner membrane transporter RhtA